MKEFSKKTDIFLLITSIFVAVCSSIIISMSGNLIYTIQNLLENHVFHRKFDMEKWADTINALMTFPVFLVILFDTVLFLKFSNKSKLILIGLYFFITAFFIVFCSALGTQTVNSDMAAEILLAKECYLNKTFWPLSWHYSTEFRLLNTQLVAAPIFLFTSSWHSVKVISAIIISLFLPLSLWFVLNQLKIKSFFIRLVSCLLIFCPWSLSSWEVVQFGNYYVPHIAISFFYIGLFIAIAYNNLPEKKEKKYKIIFYILSFICGLSSIRYILQFQLPLAAVTISIALSYYIKENKDFCIKTFFLQDKTVFFPVIGLVLSGIGYILNTTILSRIYSFSEFNTLAFNSFNEIPVMRWIFDILSIFGYKDNVSVLTPSGAVNILVYVMIVFFILCTFAFLKLKKNNSRNTFVLYALIMLVFNSFVFINTEYYRRYMLILLVCISPCFSIFIETYDISVIKRTVLAMTTSVVILTSSFVCYSYILSNDYNKEKNEVVEFLKDNKYTFGYATFWNANVITYMTDGKIEVAKTDYKNRKWLTTKRYYKNDYKPEEKVFLLVSSAELENYPELLECENAVKVYQDKFYTVFNFETNKKFKEEWGKDHLYKISLRN